MQKDKDTGSRRRYPGAPVVGVGGVVVRGGQVLLVKRGHQPAKGIWSIPGGAVELGEGCRQALAREVREETGLEVEVGPLIEVVDRILPDPEGRIEYHYVLIDYLCYSPRGEARAASDAAQVRWVDRAELAGARLTPDTLGVILRGLELDRGLDGDM